MKRALVTFVSLLMIVSFTSCDPITVRKFGMEFFSEIELISSSLSIDLGDLTDENIESVYSHTDDSGNELTIKYIDLEGAGDIIEEDISANNSWTKLPYGNKIEELLKSSKANEKYAFDDIQDGYYTLSGVCTGQNEFDFDTNNFEKWYVFQIGIWDSNDETLYYISITDQSKS